MKKFTLLFFIIAYSHMFVHAQSNILVGTGQTHTTISAALLVANNGDTITLTDAVHAEHSITVFRDVVIRGYGAMNTTLDGGSDPFNYLGSIFTIPIGNTVLITDLTIENGRSLHGIDGVSGDSDGKDGMNGGAILNLGSLTVSRCIFQNNWAGNGGNGYHGEPGLNGNDVAGPGSLMPGGSGGTGGTGGKGGSGGAIANQGNLTVTNSTFNNNWAGFGGAGELGGDGGNGADGTNTSPMLFLHGGDGGHGGSGGNGGNGGDGGAIVNLSGIISKTNCTFNFNQAGESGIPGMGGFGGNGGAGVDALAGSGLSGGNGGIGGAGGAGGNVGTSGNGGAIANSFGTIHSVNNTISGNLSGSCFNPIVGNGGMGGQGGNSGMGDPMMGMPAGIPGQGGDGGNGGNGVRIGVGGGTFNDMLASFLTINSIFANNVSGMAFIFNGGSGGFGGPGGMSAGMGVAAPPGNNGMPGMPGGSQMHEDCSGTYSSEGANIVLNTTGNIGWLPLDYLNSDPNLFALDYNGGPTTTMAIPETSIANGNGLNAGITLIVPNHDQRLYNRQASPHGYDVGAYEYRTIPQTLVINEVDVKQASDDYEFIELFDGGAGNTSLDELVIVLFDGTTNESYNTISLEGHNTNNNGYFVIGSAGVPNVNLVSFTTDDLLNGTHAVAMYKGIESNFPNGTPVLVDNTLIDALVYLMDSPPSIALQALLNPGEDQINENANFAMDTVSMQRVPNGSGGQRNTSTYVTVPPTPGQENVIPTTLSANPSALNFGDVEVGDNLEIPYSLQGTYLTANVNIAAPPGFEISLTSGSGHGSVLNITPASGIIDNTIFVLFSPSAQQAYSGQIDNTTSGVGTQSVTVNGNGVVGVAVPGYEEHQILLYPNPFSDFLVLDAASFSEQIYVEIISSTGQLVTSETFNGIIIISTDHFNAGVYFIKLLINSEIVTHLLIKQ